MTGWTHEEAKRHTVVERLFERCSIYAQDMLPCPKQGEDLPREYWCERCLAATQLVAVEALAARWEREAVERGPFDEIYTDGVVAMLRAALNPSDPS